VGNSEFAYEINGPDSLKMLQRSRMLASALHMICFFSLLFSLMKLSNTPLNVSGTKQRFQILHREYCCGVTAALALGQQPGSVGHGSAARQPYLFFLLLTWPLPVSSSEEGLQLQMQGQQESVTSGKGLCWAPA